ADLEAAIRGWSRTLVFVQAEDGIRDFHVTGVQTCALPIYAEDAGAVSARSDIANFSNPCAVAGSRDDRSVVIAFVNNKIGIIVRSEERRVGKECSARCSPYNLKKKKK